MNAKSIVKNNYFKLIIIYIVSVIVRGALGCFTPKTVNCYPDEIVYLSIANSIMKSGSVMCYNLPIAFSKIAYSVLIAPAFLASNIDTSMNIISFINAGLISLGIFPVYGMARRLLKNEKRPFLVAVFYIISSALTYSMTFFTENLFYPVMLTIMYLYTLLIVDRPNWIRKKRNTNIVLCLMSLLTILAYLTKEIALFIPVTFVIVYIIEFLKRKHSLKEWLMLVGTLALVIVLVALVWYAVNSGTRNYGINFNMQEVLPKAGYIIRSAVMFLVFCLFAFGFFPLVWPMVYGSQCDNNLKKIRNFSLIMIVMIALTVAYTISAYEDYPNIQNTAHIRYVEYLFAPLLICFFALFEGKKPRMRRRKNAIVAIVAILIPVLFRGFHGRTIDNTMLFYMQVWTQEDHYFSNIQALVWGVGFCLMAIIGLLIFRKNKKLFCTLVIAEMFCLCLANTVLSVYVQKQTHTHTSQEASEMDELKSFVEANSDSDFVIYEPATGDEMLDTYLLESTNVFTVDENGLFFPNLCAYVADVNMADVQLGARYFPVKAYDQLSNVKYIIVCDDFYYTDEITLSGEKVKAYGQDTSLTADKGFEYVCSYPESHYTVYKIDSSKCMPVILTRQGAADLQISSEPDLILNAAEEDITIVMTGDILLHDRVEEYSKQADGTYNFDQIFSETSDVISRADLALVNQEVIIGGEDLGISGYPRFNAPYAIGDSLVKAGFDVICHATNHALDRGKSGLLNTINFWKSNYPSVTYTGIHDSAEDQSAIRYIEVDGAKIAVLNYTFSTNGIELPEGMSYGVDYLKESQVISDIDEAKANSDYVIVTPHWGTEYSTTVSSYQKKWTNIFLEHGVDLVIGTHPHILEPYEVLTREDGHKMLIYYSIGNYVCWTDINREYVADHMIGGIARVKLSKGQDGSLELKDYDIEAIVTHVEPHTNGITVYPLSEYTEELAAKNAIASQDPMYSYNRLIQFTNDVLGEWK